MDHNTLSPFSKMNSNPQSYTTYEPMSHIIVCLMLLMSVLSVFMVCLMIHNEMEQTLPSLF